jgi:hypothetical protein
MFIERLHLAITFLDTSRLAPRRGLSPKHRAASSGLPPCFGEVLQCVRDINVRPGQFRNLQPALIGSVQILSPGAPVLAHEPQKPAPSK